MTTTTTSTTTTTTLKVCADCVEGLTIEIIFPENQQDVNKLGTGYTLPSCFQFPSSTNNLSNNSLVGIFINDTFSFLGKLNNGAGTGGQLYYSAETCKDFENIHPNWTPGTFSRYTKHVISKSLAKDIVENTPSPKQHITIKRELASTTFSPHQICNLGKFPSTVVLPAWIRITSRSGNVVYNGCLNSNNTQFDLYICGLCLNIEHRTKISPPQYDERAASGFPIGLFNNKLHFRITDDENQYKTLGYIMWKNNRWEFHEKFNSSTGAVSGKFYGYNNSPLSPDSPVQAGAWIMNPQTPAINEKKILSGTYGCICSLPEDKSKCSCTYAGFKKDDDLTGMKRYYEIYLPKLKKIQDEEC
jgi:hypothetical protein